VNEQALIAEYTPLVNKIAWSVKRKVPPSVRFEELFQSGMIGLWKAIRGYKQENGASLSTYAGYRIYGEIIEEIRANDMLPRYNRDGHVLVAFSEQDGEYVSPSIALSDPCTQAEGKQIEREIEKVLQRLSRQEKVMIFLYQRGMVQHKIGNMFGVSESRACQVIKAATREIHHHLKRKHGNIMLSDDILSCIEIQSGITAKEIAEETGASTHEVLAELRKLRASGEINLEGGGYSLGEDIKQKIVAFLKNCEVRQTAIKIASHIGFHESASKKVLEEMVEGGAVEKDGSGHYQLKDFPKPHPAALQIKSGKSG
jgi:RNA polymerase sigma factor for flagellar operon FliA